MQRNNSISNIKNNKKTANVIVSVYVDLTVLVDLIVLVVKIINLKDVDVKMDVNVPMIVAVELIVNVVLNFYLMDNVFVTKDVFVVQTVNVNLHVVVVLKIKNKYVQNKVTKIIKFNLNSVIVGLNVDAGHSAGVGLNANVDKLKKEHKILFKGSKMEKQPKQRYQMGQKKQKVSKIT